MIKGLENVPYRDRFKEVSLFTLTKRLRGDLITIYKSLCEEQIFYNGLFMLVAKGIM